MRLTIRYKYIFPKSYPASGFLGNKIKISNVNNEKEKPYNNLLISMLIGKKGLRLATLMTLILLYFI